MTALREAAQQALEAMEREAEYYLQEHSEYNEVLLPAMDALRAALAEPVQEPVAWRDHVEQRLLTWRQRFVNKSGDQLALDDFMDKQSLDDLIDWVCDEWATPPQRKPLTEEEIRNAISTFKAAEALMGVNHVHVARAIERAHGIKDA